MFFGVALIWLALAAQEAPSAAATAEPPSDASAEGLVERADPAEPEDPVAPAEPKPSTVSAVVIEGARDEQAHAAVAAVFGITAGQPLDVAKVRLGIKRVMLTGSWADVRVSPEAAPDGSVVLFVELVPDIIVRDVVVKAPKDIPQDTLRDVVGLDVGTRFRPERVDDAAARLRAALSDLGYPKADVSIDVFDLGGDERRVTLSIDPGPPVILRRLRMVGDARLSVHEVRDLLGVQEGEPLDRPRLEQGLHKAREMLVRRRHLAARAAVTNITHGLDGTSDVTVLLDAGPRYRLRFVGNYVLSYATLRTVLHEGKMEGVDAMSVSRARATLESYYRANGYARVKTAVDDVPAAFPNDDDAERELRFFIEEGPRAEVTDVIVVGAQARNANELVQEIKEIVEVESPSSGLLRPIDVGDVDDLLASTRARDAEPRPYEVSDEGIELLPRPLIGRKPIYVEQAYAEAGRRIADLYRADGFLDVRVEGPFADFSDDGRKIRVRYNVREGARFTVGAVRFVDKRPCAENATCDKPLSPGDLLGQMEMKPGDPASFAGVAAGRAGVERNLQDNGYPFARVSEAVERVPDRSEVDVVFAIDPGPRVTIGKVRIRGNSVTQDLVILDRVTLEEKDLYSEAEVERSRQRLARLGLFSSVSIELLDDDPRATTRDLLVIVKERPQFALEVGAGASVEDGPRAFLAGEIRNIAGLGLGLRGRGQLNYPRAFYDFLYDPDDPNSPLNRFKRYNNFFFDAGQFFEGQAVIGSELPRLYGMPFDTRLHVDTLLMREIRPVFTLNRFSILGGVDTQPATWLHVGPQIEGEISDFDCPAGQTCEGTLVRRTDSGFIRQTTYRVTSSVDLRDNPIRPRAGLWISGVTDLALGSGELRLSGDAERQPIVSDFVKVTGAAVGYVPLGPEFTWAISGRAGNIFPITNASNEYIPLFKRFYAGGTSSVRGFREDEIHPADDCAWPATSLNPLPPRDDGADLRVVKDGLTRDPDCNERSVADPGQSLGGNFVLNARSEIRVTLVGDLELGTFVDVGQLLEDVGNFTPQGFAAGAGIGLRYNTPVGPFVVDVGWKVLDGRRRLPQLTSLERMNLHLSIGYF